MVGAAAAHAIAGQSTGLVELIEEYESDFSKKSGGAVAAATAVVCLRVRSRLLPRIVPMSLQTLRAPL